MRWAVTPNMPLILAIEPDRRQTTKLAMLARNQLHADLLITDTVQQALTTLDDHDPDLILTSPLLSTRDHAALAERVRELAEDGLRVQMLALPIFGVPGQRVRAQQKGAPVRPYATRGRATPGDGMDPVVFGMQISAHLERTAADRAAAGPVSQARRPARPHLDERVEDVEARVEARVEEQQTRVEQGAPPPARWDTADWGGVLSAMQREIDSAQPEAGMPAAELVPADVAYVSLELRGADQEDDVTEQPANAAAVVQAESAPVEAAALDPHSAVSVAPTAATPGAGAEPAASVAPASLAAAPRVKRIRRVPPQDEFGFFDPRQCGFSALFAKLNAIDEHATPAAKKPA